jgi:hypothetical protein
MANETMRSPLIWSIGGVGLVVGGLVALSYWRYYQPEFEAQPDAMPIEATAPVDRFEPLTTNPWDRAMEFGWEAAVAAQTAATEMEWRRVGDLWLQAIAELEQVPQDSPRRAEVQAKIQEYLVNFDHAESEKAKARPAPQAAAPLLSGERLKPILADGPMKAQFSASSVKGQPMTIGTTVNGQARVELLGPIDSLTQVNLVLPKSEAASPLTMANLVYAHHVLSAAVMTEEVPKQWLTTSLKQVEATPDRPVSQVFGAYRVQIGQDSMGNGVVVTITPGG